MLSNLVKDKDDNGAVVNNSPVFYMNASVFLTV